MGRALELLDEDLLRAVVQAGKEQRYVERAQASEVDPGDRVQQVELAPQRGTGEGIQPSLLQPADSAATKPRSRSRSAPSACPTSSPPGRPVTAGSSSVSCASSSGSSVSEQNWHAARRRSSASASGALPMSLPSARRSPWAARASGSVCRGSPRCRPCVAARGQLGLLLSASHRWGGSSSGLPDWWPSSADRGRTGHPAARRLSTAVDVRYAVDVRHAGWSGTPDPQARSSSRAARAQHRSDAVQGRTWASGQRLARRVSAEDAGGGGRPP